MKDVQISEFLVNFDVSDCEDVDEDEVEEDLQASMENIEEDAVPREAESEWEEPDEEPLSNLASTSQGASHRRSVNRSLTWIRSENFRNAPDIDPPLEEISSIKNSYQYFSRYIDPSFFDIISICTNTSSVNRTGKSLNTTAKEIRTFIGCSMAIGILGLPRIRMFWAAKTRVKLISETITRNRYFNIRANIKVVEDHQISTAMKELDRFWKVRPIVSQIEKACRENRREKCVAIDEQIIPFTGKCKQKQVVKGKPNPEGIKVFLMANPNGLPLDLYLYQGKGSTIDSVLYPLPEKIDLGGRVVLKLADTLPQNTSIYFDRYFTSIPLLDNLVARNMHGTGTLMKNRVPEYTRPNQKKKKQKTLLKSDRTLQTSGRGSYDSIVRQDEKVAVIKWLDSKPIHIASTESAVQPLGTCRRWSKKDQQYLTVTQPVAIKKYNSYMGGIDLLDRIMAKYPMRGRTGKWTVRTIFHFFDFAAASAWIEYRNDALKNGLPRKQIMQYLDFKMDLAEQLIYDGVLPPSMLQCSSPTMDRITRNSPRQSPMPLLLAEQEEALPASSSRKHRLVEPIPHVSKRVKEAQHLPVCVKGNQNNRSKCRRKGCHQLTFVKCSGCNIFLCFNVNRNCFYEFHTKQNDYE